MVIGHGILYSAGMDLCIRSWHVESLEEIGCVQVCCLTTTPHRHNQTPSVMCPVPPLLLPLLLFPPQKAHTGMASAMACSKDFLFTSFLGCIKV